MSTDLIAPSTARSTAAGTWFRRPQAAQPAGVRAAAPAARGGEVTADSFTLSRDLKSGLKGTDVRQLQELLVANRIDVDMDGVFGSQTRSGVRQLQRRLGVKADGIFGEKTLNALRTQGREGFLGTTNQSAGPLPAHVEANRGPRVPVGALSPEATRRALEANLPARSRPGTPAEGRAVFTETFRGAGRLNEGRRGKITVNGNTYDFSSGGGGRGYLPPGEYTVTRHRDSRLDKSTMRVGNTGYSFALNNKFDSRVGATRTALRIHPDGGGEGTIGCIGIRGDEATQRRFRADMLAAIRANGGSYKLVVG